MFTSKWCYHKLSRCLRFTNAQYFRGMSLSSSTLSQQEKLRGDDAGSKEDCLPFSGSRRGCFFQDPPNLGNQFTKDAHLKSIVNRILPKQVYAEILPDLHQFGDRVSTDILSMGVDCEFRPPTLDHFDAWGRRVDRINTCEGWKQLHDVVSAQEGLIAIAYERKYEQWSRIYHAVKLYLFCPSSGLYSCPLAMTDDAAKTLEICNPSGEMFKQAYSRLTSRNPSQFWTSGQWMTERQGGSDVANGTETIAMAQADGTYSLHGYKWFSSATDADMTLTLARVKQPDGSTIPGSKGLTMFYLETRDSDGQLNNIEVQRLKNKLGTRQLPTAELLLDGTIAHKTNAPDVFSNTVYHLSLDLDWAFYVCRWCFQDMIPVLTNLDQNLYDNKSTSLDIALVMDVQKDHPLVEN